MKTRLRFSGYDCAVVFSHYAKDGAPAILLRNPIDGTPIATATVWVEGLQPGEVAIKTYSEGAGMDEALIAAGIIQPIPHRLVMSEWVSIPIFELTGEALLAAHAVPV